MNIACSKAYTALGLEEYRDTAIRNMDFCCSISGEMVYIIFIIPIRMARPGIRPSWMIMPA